MLLRSPAGLSDRRRHVGLDNQQRHCLIADTARAVALAAFGIWHCVLILAKRNVAGAELDARAVYRVHEPLPRERHDSIDLGLLVPHALPAGRLHHGDDRCRSGGLPVRPFRRRRRRQALKLEIAESAAGEMAHAFAVGPIVPVMGDGWCGRGVLGIRA